VRAYRAVGGNPPFIARGEGPWIFDVDGRRYLDLVCSWGPLILGHRPAAVLEALHAQLERGWTFGAPTEGEVRLAAAVSERMPAIEMLRLVNSGTEAAMSAVRLARGVTHRSKLIKFAGGYHGHADAFLISAGSGALTLGTPDSPGITAGTTRDTISLPFNDLAALRAAFETYPAQIACVIVEPYAGNMGLVLPKPGFLAGLRELTKAHDAILIFDEVMTGFRVGPGGVQQRENILPDITTLGKVIGGGLPVGAFGGRAEIMEQLSPVGAVYQAGTLSGNPLAMAAGIATLRLMQGPGVYEKLDGLAARLIEGLDTVFARHGIPHQASQRGSMFGFFFTNGPVVDLASAKTSDVEFYARFFHAMLERGFYFAPSQFEAGFVSTAHDQDAIDRTIAACDDAIAALHATA